MSELRVEYLPLSELKPYKGNAKIHTDEQIEQICASIRQFGFNDPIAIWRDGVIIEGHGRLEAARRLQIETVPVIRLDSLTDEERRAYTLAHNKLTMNTDFDFSILTEELSRIEEIDMSDFGFDMGESDFLDYDLGEVNVGALSEHFIVPPFSVLDTKSGGWRERKQEWLKITGNLSATRDGEYGTLGGSNNKMLSSINGGTSNFDPVLAEVMYKWFNINGGHILDPFGGEQTKGVVAGECGYRYTAVEMRQEQVDTDRNATKDYEGVRYICGDSNNISTLITERNFDMCFTSPPYYDLEVYSKEDMSALGTYEEFIAQYKNIFAQCYDMLAENTFCVVKVGEIRDKKTGIYRNFVGDTIRTLTDIGFLYYNELVLVNHVGTLRLRVNGLMKTRKVGKMHQNVLVFYKGNPKAISAKYPQLNFDELQAEPDDGEDELYIEE